MKFWYTIRVRLLSAFGFVALLTTVATVVSLIALDSTAEAVRQVSQQHLPETYIANGLSTLNYRMADKISDLATSPNDVARQRNFVQYNELFYETKSEIESLLALTENPEKVNDLISSRLQLLSIADAVNTAQQKFLESKSQREGLLKEAHIGREALQLALERAIDDADELDVETYLRTGLAANLIAASYAELAFADTPEAVQKIQDRVAEQADEISINIALLGKSMPENVVEKSKSFLSISEGDGGLFAMRLQEIDALFAAKSARTKAEKISNTASDQIDVFVNDIRQVVEEAAMYTTTQAQGFKVSLWFVAVLTILASAVVCWLYVARDLLYRIGNLSTVMKAVSKGDLSAQADSLDTQDELGEMARALEVFRENAKDMVRLHAEKAIADEKAQEKEKAERQREADREQAQQDLANAERLRNEQERRVMMSRLRSAFGAMVKAAGRGDFSERVTETFEDPELNELAEGLNTLAATVQDGLAETRQVLAAVAKYDLSFRIEGQYEGEFEQLKDGVNATADNLTEIVGQLQFLAVNLREATGELLDGADDLTSRTSQQAAKIEETSSSTEQLARSVKENADRVVQARSCTLAANTMAENGGVIMHEATQAIDRIAASSSKISDIIGVIDNIAFQTNLLSLNASVEAARAGDAGSGFAVVASEVRRLAQSASDSSKEIKTLIDASVTDVQRGVELVSSAASSLEGIVTTVSDVTKLMNAIADDSREQSGSLDDVNLAIRDMDQMIQHNSTIAQQTNEAISVANVRVADIDDIASGFTLKAREGTPAPEIDSHDAIRSAVQSA